MLSVAICLYLITPLHCFCLPTLDDIDLQDSQEMKNLRVSRRKEIIKIRAEINEKETKETIAKINKAKSGSLRR